MTRARFRHPRRYRHAVSIEQKVVGSPAQKADGSPDFEWVEGLSGVSAEIEPLRGRELFAAQEHHSEVTTRICVRYREGIDATMRVVHEGVYYSIVAVLDSGMRHRELELLCKSGVRNGR